MTLVQLASEIGCDRSTISRRLAKAGIDIKTLRVAGSTELTPEGEQTVREVMHKPVRNNKSASQCSEKVTQSDAHNSAESDAHDDAHNNSALPTLKQTQAELYALQIRFADVSRSLAEKNIQLTKADETISDLKKDIADLKSVQEKHLAIIGQLSMGLPQAAPVAQAGDGQDHGNESDHLHADGQTDGAKKRKFFDFFKKK